MFGINFYPTPPSLVEQMLEGLNFRKIKSVLEPSTGKGDICKGFLEKRRKALYSSSDPDPAIFDVVEIVPNLSTLLKGAGYHVIHDDFMPLHTFKHYDLILMNPPFSVGGKHLSKALDMQKNGGQIRCILYAETIRNPRTKSQIELVSRLDAYGTSYSYIQNAFIGTERESPVEIVLIFVDIPTKTQSNTLDNLRNAYIQKDPELSSNQIIDSDPVNALIQCYNFEVEAGCQLINEYKGIENQFGSLQGLELKMQDSYYVDINDYIRKVRQHYWGKFFHTDIFSQLLSSKLREFYYSKVRELGDYDFSPFNINQIQLEVTQKMQGAITDSMIGLFDELFHTHHYNDEYSSNRHLYDGWKTNQAWYINSKVVITLNAWPYRNYEPHTYAVVKKLEDIERVLNILDAGKTAPLDINIILEEAEANNQTKNIQLKYFSVTFYKKGTCHIQFTDLELLKKFNLHGSLQKGWLPPCYGKKQYHEMTPDEQQVIDSFEGPKAYE